MAKSVVSKCPGSSQVKKTCEVCGAVFWRKKSHAEKAKYCSKQCASLGLKRSGSKFVYKCENCGIEFTRYKSAQKKRAHNFCSRKCASILTSNRNKEGRQPRKKVECVVCKKTFYVIPSEYNRACNKNIESWFCSKDCYHERRSGHNIRGLVEVVCYWCGKPKKVSVGHYMKCKHFFCDIYCQSQHMAEFMDGKKSNFYKDGSCKAGFASFAAYSGHINYAFEIRRSPEKPMFMDVKCSYCGQWFTPNRIAVKNVVSALSRGKDPKFYCSDACKEECPVYRRVLYPKGFKRASSREVSKDLRQMCLERDGWECQRCGKTEPPLHCHHIDGAVQNKIISNDLENVITLCKACHKEVHKQAGCKYHELRCDVNNVQYDSK